MALTKIDRGDIFTRSFVALKPMVVCKRCHYPISWYRGDYWHLADDAKIKCPTCSLPFRVGELPELERRDMAKCPTCGYPANQPYRRYDKDGVLFEGCVDKCHDEYVRVPKELHRIETQ